MRRDNILDKLGWLESLGKLGSTESFFKPETEACNAEWAAAQGWVKYSTIRALEKKTIVSIGVFWFIWDTKGCQLLYLKYRTDLFLLSGP